MMELFQRMHSVSCAALVAVLMIPACGMGPRTMNQAPISLETLLRNTGLPAPCDTPIGWEGEPVTLRAYVDAANIFDKSRYPQLPYEKFRLVDRQGGSVEVWAGAADNKPIFDRLAQRPTDEVIVAGRLAAVKLPVAGQCRLGLKVLIHDAMQIRFP